MSTRSWLPPPPVDCSPERPMGKADVELWIAQIIAAAGERVRERGLGNYELPDSRPARTSRGPGRRAEVLASARRASTG